MKKIVLWIGIVGISTTLNAQETVQGINFHAEHSSYNSSGIHDSHIKQWNRLSLALKSENNSFRIEDWRLGSSNVKTIFSANADGGIGIGTTYTGNAIMTINGDSYNTLRLENDIPNKEASLRFRSRSSSGGMLHSDISLYATGSNQGYLGFKVPHNNSANFGYDMIINHLGNIGVGTTNPDGWKLAVNGKIRAKEIKVETGWSDFVFEKEYNLPTLTEVENHIIEKGHLKDIPSAKEVSENGIFLGEMNSKLLQKIEELTLYTIEQEKKIKKLEKENQELKSLSDRLSKLEKLLLEPQK